MDALANLDKSNDVIKNTWCINDLFSCIDELTETFQKETIVKRIVAGKHTAI